METIRERGGDGQIETDLQKKGLERDRERERERVR